MTNLPADCEFVASAPGRTIPPFASSSNREIIPFFFFLLLLKNFTCECCGVSSNRSHVATHLVFSIPRARRISRWMPGENNYNDIDDSVFREHSMIDRVYFSASRFILFV